MHLSVLNLQHLVNSVCIFYPLPANLTHLNTPLLLCAIFQVVKIKFTQVFKAASTQFDKCTKNMPKKDHLQIQDTQRHIYIKSG